MKDKLKNKKVIAGIIAGIAIVVVLVVFVFINQSSLKVKSKEVTIEYGQQLSIDPKDYLDEDEKIINKTTASVKEDVAMEGKDYYPVGEYTLVLVCDKESTEVKIIVKDTTAPIFKDFKDTVETVKDVKPEYTKLYAADDLSQIEITVADENVKYDTVGEYKATVKATDEYKNVTDKEITVKVTEPVTKLNKTSLSLYVKETSVLDVEVKGKDKAIFKSSNTDIVSVDENGKVTAKKSGTATITVSANGKEASCKVTVKAIPSGSTTSKKTVTNPTTGKKEEVTIVKPSGGGSGSSGSSGSSIATTSMEAFNLINAERAKVGLPAYQWSDSLASSAKIRAKEITEKYSHVRPDGSNILGMQINSEIIGVRPSSQSIVSAWMDSTGHRNAILRNDLSQGAVARCGNHWVALFGY